MLLGNAELVEIARVQDPWHGKGLVSIIRCEMGLGLDLEGIGSFALSCSRRGGVWGEHEFIR